MYLAIRLKRTKKTADGNWLQYLHSLHVTVIPTVFCFGNNQKYIDSKIRVKLFGNNLLDFVGSVGCCWLCERM
jgi:hypothetical protein